MNICFACRWIMDDTEHNLKLFLNQTTNGKFSISTSTIRSFDRPRRDHHFEPLFMAIWPLEAEIWPAMAVVPFELFWSGCRSRSLVGGRWLLRDDCYHSSHSVKFVSYLQLTPHVTWKS